VSLLIVDLRAEGWTVIGLYSSLFSISSERFSG
jgi:hypothetical protein